MRTFALLGVHGLRRGDRGHRAELHGRQGFPRDPASTSSRARSRRSRATSAYRPPRPACWRRRRSSRPSPRPGGRRAWRGGCRWSSTRSARPCTATRCCTRGAGFASHRTVSARHAGHAQPRRGAAAGRHRRRRRCVPAGCGPRSARARPAVGAGQGRPSAVAPRRAPTCCSTAPTSTSSTRTRIDTGRRPRRRRHARRRDGLRAGARLPVCPTRWRSASRWVTECLRAAYPLGHGHGPVSPLFRLSESP